MERAYGVVVFKIKHLHAKEIKKIKADFGPSYRIFHRLSRAVSHITCISGVCYRTLDDFLISERRFVLRSIL